VHARKLRRPTHRRAAMSTSSPLVVVVDPPAGAAAPAPAPSPAATRGMSFGFGAAASAPSFSFGAHAAAPAPAIGGFGALNDDVLGVIAQFVGMRGATDLRATNKVLRDVVARVAWRIIEDLRGSQLRRWRACFPRATAAKVSSAKDEDLQWLGGVTTLILTWCDKITDEGLRHLVSVTTLNLRGCSKITDEGLRHLGSVTTCGTAARSWTRACGTW
jgi:hypothetical protein